MTVFVSGGWQPEEISHFKNEAYLLGKRLAEEGFNLTIGPGTGVARFVIDGYRSVKKRGRITFYLPRLKEMKRVGEEMEEGADRVVETEADYPVRNLIQVRESEAVVGIAGSAGTLTEIIAAVMDYHKPTVMLDGVGEAVAAAKCFNKIREKIYFARSIEDIIQFLKKALKNSPPNKFQPSCHSEHIRFAQCKLREESSKVGL